MEYLVWLSFFMVSILLFLKMNFFLSFLVFLEVLFLIKILFFSLVSGFSSNNSFLLSILILAAFGATVGLSLMVSSSSISTNENFNF